MKCPYCGEPAQWVPNEVIYGRRYGRSYMAWYCRKDNAYVGCHNNTKTPLGTMANKELRQWRVKAHAHIDPLWKSGRITRKKLYKRLNGYFGREVHIGEADIRLCKAIVAIPLDDLCPNPLDRHQDILATFRAQHGL